jgi:hypothetical protein
VLPLFLTTKRKVDPMDILAILAAILAATFLSNLIED